MSYSKSLFLGFSLVGLGVLLMNTIIVQAFSSHGLDGANFDPGRIIDDQVFSDTETMTIEEIQSFLENNVEGGECDRYRENIGSAYQPPFTCLFEFQQNPETGENNYGLFNGGAPEDIDGGLTAAEIIKGASETYSINPQVLIVLLQKEQSLITDNWPWTKQYAKATGYACPDDNPCNPQQADFYKQVYGAAWQFRKYLDHTDDYWYIIGENNIFYHPNTSCGHKKITIKNKATIALYLYTPYAPNQAALDNLFNTGDSCSAYGNRNFWTYFQYWFGSTLVDQEYRSISYQAFKDEELQHLITNDQVEADSTVYLSLSFENLSFNTWQQDSDNRQVSLRMFDGDSPLNCDDEACYKTFSLEENQVAPGEIGSFLIPLEIDSELIEIEKTFQLFGDWGNLKGQPLTMSFTVTQPSASPDQTPPIISLKVNQLSQTIKATATDDSAIVAATWGHTRINPPDSNYDCSTYDYDLSEDSYLVSYKDLEINEGDNPYYYCFTVKDDSDNIGYASTEVSIDSASAVVESNSQPTSASSSLLAVVREGEEVVASGTHVSNFEYVLMKVTDTACASVDFSRLYMETKTEGQRATWQADKDFCFRATRDDNDQYVYGHLDQAPGQPSASSRQPTSASSSLLAVVREGEEVVASGTHVSNFEYVLMKVTDTACASVDFSRLYMETKTEGQRATWQADKDFCFRATRDDNDQYVYGHLDQAPGQPSASSRQPTSASSSLLAVVREGEEVVASGTHVSNFEYVLMKVTDTACASVDFSRLYMETKTEGQRATWQADKDFCFRATRDDNDQYVYGHLDQAPGQPSASSRQPTSASSSLLAVVREGEEVVASGTHVSNFEYVLMKVTDTACASVDFSRLYMETKTEGQRATWQADKDFCFRATRDDNDQYVYGHLDQ